MSSRIPDTYWTIREELALFGGSCLLGIPTGLLFDGFRAFRRCVRHPAWAVAIEDALWLLGAAVLLLVYASACAKGVFRAYYAAGCLLGFILYEMTLGQPAMRLFDAVRKLLAVPFRWVKAGFITICTKLEPRFVGFAKIRIRGQENTQKRLQRTNKKVYNVLRNLKKGQTHGKIKTPR